MIPLIGFAPDSEPQTPGIFTDCQNIIPYESGFRGAPQPIAVGLPALISECRGAGVVSDLSGGKRLLAGTAAKLYESTGSAWDDVSDSTAGYVLGDDDGWSFAQIGNTSLAATKTEKIQKSASGDFSDITSAPKADVIESVTNFVLAFNTDDGVYGESPDRWWCCALYDPLDWTPDISTQATTGRLLDGQGAIRAAKRLGSQIVAYKERGVFVGQYVGAPVVWDWQAVSEDVGCVGRDAVAITSIGHIFVGTDNVYLFDGSRPIPLGTGVMRQWWIDNSSSQYRHKTKLLWDRFNNLVWMFFPSVNSDGAADYCLVYHVLKKQWGRADNTAEAVLTYITNGSFTYDTGTDLITTYDDPANPTLAFDSVLWLNEAEAPAIFASNHQLKALSAEPGNCTFTTGQYGDNNYSSMCNEVRLLFKQTTNVADCLGYFLRTSGANPVPTTSVAMQDGKFSVRQTGRYHLFAFSLAGDVRFSGIEVDLKPAGRRGS